jgi:four helix bundle protein
MNTDRSQDIRDRTFAFACRVARLCLDLASRPGARRIVEQLLKSGTSIGANLEEAKAGSSRRDFLRYVEISLREARETIYWLRIFLALQLGPTREVQDLCGEAEQIARILGAIVVKSKRRLVFGPTVFAFCMLHVALLSS